MADIVQVNELMTNILLDRGFDPGLCADMMDPSDAYDKDMKALEKFAKAFDEMLVALKAAADYMGKEAHPEDILKRARLAIARAEPK